MAKSHKLSSKKKVLDQQKPKRRYRFFGYFRTLFILLLLVGSGFAAYTSYQSFDLNSWIQDKRHQTETNLVHLTIFPELEKEDEKSVRYIFKNLNNLKRSDLKDRLAEAQKILAAKAISIIQIRPFHFALFIEFHKPKFAIELGTTRFVTSEGQIYGFFKEGQHSWLPILTGLKLTEKPRFLPDQTMEIDGVTKSVVNEALLLLELSLGYNITYRDIYYDPYRGFRGNLSNHRISVELGREPFDTRLSRLRKILDDLTEKGVPSAKIELDFQDKAFVRELGS